MKFEERLTETRTEGRSRFGDSAFRSGEFCGKAAEEIIFRLFRSEDGNRRKYAESVRTQENDGLSRRAVTVRTDNVFNVVNRIAYAGIFGYALVGKIDLAVFVNGDVFQKCVAVNCVINIRLRFFVEVDDFCIATAFKVKYAGIVPAVLVVADKQAFRVGGKSGLACAGKSEENRGVFAVHVGICGAVHRGNTFEREEVVHHAEHTLFHFAAVPSVEDNLFFACYVKDDGCIGVQAEFFEVFNFCLRCIIDDEIRLLIKFRLIFRTDKHIGYEVSLPSNFHNETDFHAGIFVSAAETVNDIKFFV